MLDPKVIKEALNGYLLISDELALKLAQITEIRHYNKNEKIYEGGTIASSVGIIKKGLVRSYIVNEQREMTIWFGEVGDFITSFYSFFTGEVGVETIECIEDTTILVISTEEFKEIMTNNLELMNLYSVILEKGYIYWEQRYAVNQMYESEQRYSLFYNRSKSMVIKVPLKILSSYLNIRQETLSRIRKKWLK